MHNMAEKNYSKRELDHYFTDIKQTLVSQNIILERIEQQTTKTNGRVSKLEFWRGVIIWGFGVLLTITLFILNYIK